MITQGIIVLVAMFNFHYVQFLLAAPMLIYNIILKKNIYDKIEDYKEEDFEQLNYNYHEKINMEMRP